MQDIFISYSRKDLARAKQIKADIEEHTNVLCWMDMEGIECGEQFEDVIIRAIDNSKIVVVLLSGNSMQSKWVKDEVRYAFETKKKVVPLKIDDSALKGWFLFKFSGLDIITYSNADQKNKMMNDLKAWIGEGPVGPSPKPEPKIQKWGIVIQVAIFALLTLIFVGLLFMNGPIGADKNCIAMRNNDLLLILDLLAVIGCTIKIKKYKWCKWSFLVLDVIALYFMIGLGRDSYLWSVAQEHKFDSWEYSLLYGLGQEYKVSPISTWKYFIPLYIFHNTCVLVIMYSRTLWDKLPYKLRRLTK